VASGRVMRMRAGLMPADGEKAVVVKWETKLRP
jgi:hypothetical protein